MSSGLDLTERIECILNLETGTRAVETIPLFSVKRTHTDTDTGPVAHSPGHPLGRFVRFTIGTLEWPIGQSESVASELGGQSNATAMNLSHIF